MALTYDNKIKRVFTHSENNSEINIYKIQKQLFLKILQNSHKIIFARVKTTASLQASYWKRDPST